MGGKRRAKKWRKTFCRICGNCGTQISRLNAYFCADLTCFAILNGNFGAETAVWFK